MPSFTEKEWKTKRMPEAEGSGVAGAIKGFNAAWPGKLSEVDAKALIEAGDAITTFETALKKAKGKCESAKKPDPKKLKITIDLIETWLQDLANCRTALNNAREQKQKKVAEQIENEREETREKIIAHILKSYQTGLLETLKSSGGELDDLKKAIDKGDIKESYKLQTNISKALRTVGAQLTIKAVQEKLGYAMRDVKCKDDNIIQAKACVPKEFPAWKKALGVLNTRLENLEGELDQAEQKAQLPDPATAGGSPEYKKNLKVVMDDYSDVSEVCEMTLSNVLKLAGQAKRLESAVGTLPPEKLPAAKDLGKKMVVELGKAEERMKTEVSKVRSSGSELVRKKQGFGISTEDEAKFLAPILNKMFSKNLRAIKVIADTERLLDEVLAA